MERSHVAKNSKRLAIDIPVQLHDELMKFAKMRHCTLKSYVIQMLVKRLIEEEKYYTEK